MENHGTKFETRHKLARERVEAMKAIWTKSKPEYHGEMVNFDPMMTWPKPAQKPHPPILVGGAFPYAARRAIRYGDGWMPHRARPQYPNVRDLLPEFRKMAAEANREMPVTIWGAKDEDMLKQDRDAGVVRVIISLESAKSDAILPSSIAGRRWRREWLSLWSMSGPGGPRSRKTTGTDPRSPDAPAPRQWSRASSR